MFCRYCGTQTKETDIFCTNCGQRLQEQPPSAVLHIEEKNKPDPGEMPTNIASGNAWIITLIVLSGIQVLLCGNMMAVAPLVLACIMLSHKSSAQNAWNNGLIDSALAYAHKGHKLSLWGWITFGISTFLYIAFWGAYFLMMFGFLSNALGAPPQM